MFLRWSSMRWADFSSLTHWGQDSPDPCWPVREGRQGGMEGWIEEGEDVEWQGGGKRRRNVRLQPLSPADTEGPSPCFFSPQIGPKEEEEAGRKWGRREKKGIKSQDEMLLKALKRTETDFFQLRGGIGWWGVEEQKVMAGWVCESVCTHTHRHLSVHSEPHW